MPVEVDLIIKNAAELLTLCPFSGGEAGLGIVQNGAVAVKGKTICWTGPTEGLESTVTLSRGGRTVDATGKVIMPGLIDGHTHLVFAGSREREFEERIQGLTYTEISERGGGILSTVDATRNASFDDLFSLGMKRLDRMLAKGVTTVEAKSGYGLSVDEELKILRVMKALNEHHAIDVVPTFLGAHTVPKEFKSDREGYVNLVAEEMIPRVAEESLAEFCDVFCEQTAFRLEESRRILEAGQRYGLNPKIHADQFSPGGGAELAAELGASSADHLDHISPAGMARMAEKKVAAVLLPGASFFLSTKIIPPVRQMIESGVPVAIATDLNPGTSMTESLPLIMTMGCTLFKMTPAEVVQAVTLYAAKSIGRDREIGSLEAGKKADLVVFDVPNYRYLPYHFGVDHAEWVIKGGQVIFQRGEVQHP